MTRPPARIVALVMLAATAAHAHAQDAAAPGSPGWKPVPGKLMTRWATDVSPDKVLPEYPRPQMVRPRWQNLNGLWDYAIKPKAEQAPASFDGKILVPFPIESALSGVGKPVKPDDKLWYRRSFAVPADWRTDGQRLLLHFGAVDWDTTVSVNGKPVGSHRGGYDPFSFDVTDALKGDGEQQLTVEVSDPTDASYQPRGKQVRNPHGIWYTPTTGIWQTVWIEPVPAAHIKSIRVVPNVDQDRVEVTAEIVGTPAPGTMVYAEVPIPMPDKPADELPRVRIWMEPGRRVDVPLPNQPDRRRLWTPDDPYLYGITVSLLTPAQVAQVKADGGDPNGAPLDKVESYFGLRKLSVGKDDKGVARLLLNDKFVFQYGPLDQGFWPDGLYTAPTDAALKYDLEVTKRLGFNMVRKHVKTEPARWYHYCDQMGLLVWQDMPNGDAHIGATAKEDHKRSPESMANYEREWTNIISALRNHPCIVMWVPFNEGWGQSDTARIADFTKKLDPTRWVNSASGWTDRGVGDVLDLHVYPGPTPTRESIKTLGARALVLGEFGGLGLPLAGHTWQDEKNWGYRSFTSPEALTDAYVDLLTRLHPLVADPGYSAAVYTQTTDVEIEVNGLMTYDRAVMKVDERRVTEAARKLYGPPPVITAVVPDARTGAVAWRYATEKPADGWEQPGFDDAGWKSGPGGFGTADTPGTAVRTEWKGQRIWVRRSFDLPASATPGALYLMIHHDEDADVYLNGVLAAKLAGYTTEYSLVPIAAAARKALKPGGQNTIAIHCRQTRGGQYVDAGIVEVK